MSRKRKVNPEILHKLEQELLTWCYEHEEEITFSQYNKYHFRLFSKTGKILDVWPISKTYWNSKMSESRTYQTPNDFKRYLLN